MERSLRFQWPDYVVFTLGMLVNAGIGVYYAIQRYRNSKSGVTEYLMGSRNMGIIPVAVSLIVSLLSAVTVMGFPSEVYSYGISIALFILAYALSLIITGTFYLPVYHTLKLTSVFEYLEMRYNSHVRALISAVSFLSMMMVSAVNLYVPSLAISQVTGMSYLTCIVISAALSTFYTILGGFKSVLWTDTLQACIMIFGMLITFSKGTIDAGGIKQVMNISRIGGRLDIPDVVPSVFKRYNAWGWLLGDLFLIMSIYGAGQPFVQRVCSVSSIHKARASVLLAVPVMTSILLLAMLSGLVAFAYYFGCDPLSSGKINRRDQLIPALVMDVFQSNPGMPGVFLTSVFSAALSTMSSLQHSSAAMLLQDFLTPLKLKVSGKPFNDREGTILSQAIVFLYGVVVTTLAIAVASMGKMVLQLMITYQSLATGPPLGIFTAGIFFSFTNSLGAMSGFVVSVAMLMWINAGSLVYPSTTTKPLPVFNHLCPLINTSTAFFHNSSYYTYTDANLGNSSMGDITVMPNIRPGLSGGLQIYSIPYRYHAFLASSIALGVCLVVSLVTGGWRNRQNVPQKLLFSWKQHGINKHWSVKENSPSPTNVEEQVEAKELFKQESK